MSDKKPGKLSQALSTTKKNEGGAKEDVLKGALIPRKDTATAPVEGPKTSNLPAVHKAVHSSSSTTDAIINDDERARRHLKGLCFVIDATASREHSWKEAQSIQAKMFDALKAVGNMDVGIVCHRGGKVQPLGWFKEADSAKKAMAKINCVGGNTRIVEALQVALVGQSGSSPSSIIMVGDCFEEDFDALEAICYKLAQRKIKVYAFLEGNDNKGHAAYSKAAEMTGGVFKKFGDDLSLTDLCVAAAVRSSGNKEAFQRLISNKHKGALALGAEENLQLTDRSAAAKKFLGPSKKG